MRVDERPSSLRWRTRRYTPVQSTWVAVWKALLLASVLCFGWSATAQDRNASPLVLISPGEGWSYSDVRFERGSCQIEPSCRTLEPPSSLVTAEFAISEIGIVQDLVLGNSCGARVDLDPVLATVERWKFNPRLVSGRPATAEYACAVLSYSPSAD